MYLNETNKDMDIWLINIGGAIGPLNGMNLYKFGKLADAYLSASNVDILVLCVILPIFYLHSPPTSMVNFMTARFLFSTSFDHPRYWRNFAQLF